MKILRDYINTLDKPSRQRFAEECGAHFRSILNISYGCNTPSVEMAIKINKASRGELPVEKIRPDIDWAYLRDNLQQRNAA